MGLGLWIHYKIELLTYCFLNDYDHFYTNEKKQDQVIDKQYHSKLLHLAQSDYGEGYIIYLHYIGYIKSKNVIFTKFSLPFQLRRVRCFRKLHTTKQHTFSKNHFLPDKHLSVLNLGRSERNTVLQEVTPLKPHCGKAGNKAAQVSITWLGSQVTYHNLKLIPV